MKETFCFTIKSFFTESYFHGFKYLATTDHFLSKFLWLIVLSTSFSTSIYLIQDSYSDWQNNPIITSIDTLESPLKEIQFPTVTFCHERYHAPDNWALPEILYNFIDYGKSQSLKQDFYQIFALLFKEASEVIDKLEVTKESVTPVTKEYQNILYNAIVNNDTSLAILQEKLISVIGQSKSIWAFIEENLGPNMNTSQAERCDESCENLKSKAYKFLLKVDTLKGVSRIRFGTILRQSSLSLGESFKNSIFKNSLSGRMECSKINEMEVKIHKILDSLKQTFNTNLSVIDLPNFFKISSIYTQTMEYTKSIPYYTICGLENKEIYEGKMKCKSHWKFTVFRKDEPSVFRDVCIKDIQELQGQNLTSIFFILKIAYHLGSFENLKLLHSAASNSDIIYPIIRYKTIVKKKEYSRPFSVFRNYSFLGTVDTTRIKHFSI